MASCIFSVQNNMCHVGWENGGFVETQKHTWVESLRNTWVFPGGSYLSSHPTSAYNGVDFQPCSHAWHWSCFTWKWRLIQLLLDLGGSMCPVVYVYWPVCTRISCLTYSLTLWSHLRETPSVNRSQSFILKLILAWSCRGSNLWPPVPQTNDLATKPR